MPTVVVTGARGQLGRAIRDLQPEVDRGWDVRYLDRGALDIATTSLLDMADLLRSLDAQVVINCAAYNHVDMAESSPVEALSANAAGVANLATVCRRLKARLIHVSTDYVFDGRTSHPYAELDTPSPRSMYAISKLAGEYAARLCPEYVIVRTSGLYYYPPSDGTVGGKGTNFVESILKLTSDPMGVYPPPRCPIPVVIDQRTVPTFAKDVAQSIIRLVDDPVEWGIYHVVNSGECSWYEFAIEVLRLAGRDPSLVRPAHTDEMYWAAQRPVYSVLQNSRLPALRSWQEALQEYMQERKS